MSFFCDFFDSPHPKSLSHSPHPKSLSHSPHPKSLSLGRGTYLFDYKFVTPFSLRRRGKEDEVDLI
jgi:hypothetical protein